MSHRAALRLVVLLYVALAAATSAVVPLGEAPDEVDHFRMVDYLVRERALPVMQPVKADNVTLEANQPPLYYALGALLTAPVAWDEPFEPPFVTCFAFDSADSGRQHLYVHDAAREAWPWRGTVLAFHLVRLLSVAFGAGAVVLTQRIARRLAPGQPGTAVAAAALLAFNPQFIFITASVNNDTLTALLGAAIVAVALAWVTGDRPPTWRQVVPVGALLGAAALTKLALLALFPIPALALLVVALRGQAGGGWAARLRAVLPTLVQQAAALVLPLTVVAGWWYARNVVLYGDATAWAVHLAAKGQDVLRSGPLTPADLLEFLTLHFRSYWGLLGWLNIALPPFAYGALAVLVALGGAGALRGAWSARRTALWRWLVPALATAGVYAALLRYIQTINWSGYQGRLAYAAAAPAAALLAAGLWHVHRRLPAAAAAALGAGALATVLWLLPGNFPRPLIYEPDPALARLCRRAAPGWDVEAVEVAARVDPGAPLAVAVHGFGRIPPTQPWTLVVDLVGWQGAVIGRAQAPAFTWRAGEPTATALTLTVAADAVPTRAFLRVGLVDPATGAVQPMQDAFWRATDAPAVVAAVTVARLPDAVPAVMMPVTAVFGDDAGGRLALDGYSLADDALTLHWRAVTPPGVDYTVFVHVLDAGGAVLAQADGPPLGGSYPTGIWQAGERVVETRALTLPPGAVSVAVGWYDSADGARLRLPDGSDRFTLPVPTPP